ncbi:MAG: hypothetical protein ACQR33_01725 [Candidatus Saccharibacteria bacterium]
MEPQNPSIVPKPEEPKNAVEDASSESAIEPTTTPTEDTPSVEPLAEPTVFSMDQPKPTASEDESTTSEPTDLSAKVDSVAPETPDVALKSTEATTTEPSLEAPEQPEPATPDAPTMPEAPSDEIPSSEMPAEPTSEPAPSSPVQVSSFETPKSAAVVDSSAAASVAMPGGRRIQKKWMIIGIIILAVIVLGGGAAAAYVGYVIPNKPKYVVARAIGNTVSSAVVKTAHFDGDLTVKSTSDNQTFKGSFKGASNGTNAQVTGSLGLDVTTLTMDMRVFGGDSAYIKIDGLKGLPQLLDKSGQADLSMISPYINAVNGQWISIDQSLLSSLSKTDVSNSSVQVSAADAKKIENMYGDHPFLDVSKVQADETINGMDSHHYTVVINRDQLYGFGQELKNANIKGFPAISQDDLNGIKKVDFGKYPVDVWIDKSRTIIDQIVFTVKQADTTTSVRVALGNINQPVMITKPTGAKSLLEVLGASSTMDMSGTSMNMPMTGSSATTGLNALTN